MHVAAFQRSDLALCRTQFEKQLPLVVVVPIFTSDTNAGCNPVWKP